MSDMKSVLVRRPTTNDAWYADIRVVNNKRPCRGDGFVEPVEMTEGPPQQGIVLCNGNICRRL
ncbi:uncharacterized protein B0I36DRAFT_321954 [Microdochium trichocladiopsis]|uniref:Uncharacterized protein n=1 Tax=Microdochium trichocladiopsis TaxID=1682393 RepID=A0A9P8Y9M9_9PEZI|nr:uncharacterized protein B0I36DRAFT_321954 [Microdochium trichocladiopsis]KAH7033724.1 hypothetical protein B0I36DRAFT_321954 [Microdochium trichocladiopsis]